jgi:hypothetical protein
MFCQTKKPLNSNSMAIRIVILLAYLCGTIFSASNTFGAKPLVIPFRGGEFLEYAGFYNWGFIWLNAGSVAFRVTDTTVAGQPAFAFESTGSSHREYDWFFKVRSRFHAVAKQAELAPVYFNKDSYEGGYVVHNKYYFDRDKGKIYMEMENSNLPFTLDTIQYSSGVLDLLTAVYFSRSIDYNSIPVGSVIPINVISDGEIFELKIKYRGKDKISLRDSKLKYNCIKITVTLIEGTVFSKGEEMSIWVTDDKARIPVQVEAKVLIGSVKAVLTNATGTTYPLKAIIKK